MIMKVAIVIVLSAMVVQVAAQTTAQYCTLCADHTMCTYPTSVAGDKCKPSLGRTVSAAEQLVIIDQHNLLRNKVALNKESRGNPGPQPAAANMRKMEWDDELATVAQRWADQCAFGHDPCRKVERYGVGQNAAEESSTGDSAESNWVWAVNQWYDEVALYSKANINTFMFTEATGHYTQVVWPTTYQVGCGYAFYKTSPTDEWYNKYYICNYGPAGNVKDEPLYIDGKACSQCPTGTACDKKSKTIPGLCARPKPKPTKTTTTKKPKTTTTKKPTTKKPKKTTTSTMPIES